MNQPPLPCLPRRTVVAATLLLPYVARAQDAQLALDVPYVPTPMPVVQKMLEMAELRSGEMMYDLGCGDGRIVVTAAKERGARGVGIDLNPVRINEARANARRAKVDDRARFMVGDLFAADFSSADVVTLYLLPEVNRRLRPQLWRQLKVGARVVSHSFDMGDWAPERSERVENATIHRWTITAQQKTA
jgi:SAM-dependent methyltransferase